MQWNICLKPAKKGLKRDNDYLENLAIAYLNVGELDKGVEMLNGIPEETQRP